MKFYAFLMAFVIILSTASIALAEANNSKNNQTDDSNETQYKGERGNTMMDEFRDDRRELREEYKENLRNETNRTKVRNMMDEFRDDRRELREEYMFRMRGENVTFNYTDDHLQIMVGKINAKTGLNLTVEDLQNKSLGQIMRVYMSNGRWAEVKVMPNAASETALKRLRAHCEDRNCTVELKEVRNNSTNSTRPVYEIDTEKDSKVLGLFKSKMKVKAQVDAENGELISAHKPWWAFMASEEDASETEIENETRN